MVTTPRMLREKRAKLVNQADGLVKLAENEDRDLTQAETAKFNELIDEAKALEQRAIRLESVESIVNGLSEPINAVPRSWQAGRKADDSGNEPVYHRTGHAMNTAGHRRIETLLQTNLSTLSTGGFKNLDEFLTCIHSGLADVRLQQAATVGGNTSGGYLVPEQFEVGMLANALESSIVLPRAELHSMETDTKRVSGFDYSDSSTSIAGFVGEWLRETQPATVQEPKARQIKLSAKKLAVFTSASNEILADGTSFESQLREALQSALDYYLDTAFLSGSGDNQPRGVLNDPAIVEVAAEGPQDPGSVIYENLAKMYARLHPRSVSKAVWIVSQTLVPELLSIEIPIGTGGTFIPALREDSGRFFVLGREVLFTEKVPTAGNRGDITLCDLSQYAVGLRRGMTFERSNAVGWTSDVSHFRSIVRVDGIGKWNGPYTPANGDSLSWAVTLAARE